jgi:DNA polymerase/3'-5' exonuclease PolX
MEQHAATLLAALPASLQGTIVGSYRRKATSSGDIDMLLKGASGFKEYVAALKASKYIVEVLAEGDKKCLAICKLPGAADSKGRRLDLLVTPEAEYAYAILYFTGSDVFNVAMRKWALTKGYSLNEHLLTPLKPEETATPPPMTTEKDIFDFLGLVYVEPEDRKGEEQIKAKPKTIKIKRSKPKV